jgi:hypothetical protein
MIIIIQGFAMFCDDTMRTGPSVWPVCFVKDWIVFCDRKGDDVNE